MNTQNKSETSNDSEPSEALKEKCSHIRKMMCSADTSDARLRYNISAQVHEAMTEVGKYGKGAVEYIATEIGCTAANLYDYARVAGAWTGDEFEAAIKAPTASKMRLSFSHFVTLAKVVPPADRQALFSECIKKNYSVRDLKARIAETAPSKPAESTVRSLRPGDAVKKLVSSSSACVARMTADFEALAKVEDVSAEPLLAQIAQARAGYAKVRDLIGQLDARIAELLARAAKASEKAA
jgi:hypothetical protein